MSDPRPPATAAASGTSEPRHRAWALLDRSAELLEPGEEVSGGAEYAIKHDVPPKLSAVVVSRTPLPPLDGDVDAYVHCADSDGNLLLSVWGLGAGGLHSLLLVCRAGSGRVDLLPALPEDLAAPEFGPDACWGINPAAAGGTGSGNYSYFVVQLHQHDPAGSPSSCSSHSGEHHISALCYSSASDSWAVKDVVTKHPQHFETHSDEDTVTVEGVTADQAAQPVFEAHAVVSRGKGSGLVFADLKRGVLLLLDPVQPGAVTMLSFPSSEDSATPEAAVDAAACRFVCLAEQSLCILQISNNGSVTMSALKEQQEQWMRLWSVPIQDIVWSDAALGNRLAELAVPAVELEIGPVDPSNSKRVSFFSPHGDFAFTVQIGSGPDKHVCDFGDTNRSCLDVVAIVLDCEAPAAVAGARGNWKTALRSGTKRVGRKALQGYKFIRKHFNKASPAAQAAVTFAACVGAPGAAAAAGTVAGLIAADKALDLGEAFVTWWTEAKPTGHDDMYITTNIEAGEAIHRWVINGKPKDMKVYPGPGVSKKQAKALRIFIIGQGAEELLPVPLGEDYVHVPTALPDFS